MGAGAKNLEFICLILGNRWRGSWECEGFYLVLWPVGQATTKAKRIKIQEGGGGKRGGGRGGEGRGGGGGGGGVGRGAEGI